MIITGSNAATFLSGPHGPGYSGDDHDHQPLTCQHCHGGAADFSFASMDEAHLGMVGDPSRLESETGCLACHEDSYPGSPTAPRSACDGCHTDAVTRTSSSLHTTIAGYYTAITDRCGFDFEEDQGDYPLFEKRCAGCHATCGQCHVSRPASVGGGFPKISVGYRSHRFISRPSQDEQCTACHGSRVGTDYRGELEGNLPDAHATRGYDCVFCHDGDAMHGDGVEYDHRYEVAGMKRCENCHADDLPVSTDDCSTCHINGVGNDPVEVPADRVNHAHHVEGTTDCNHCHGGTPPAVDMPNMQCQVCHSQPYKNCTNCHALTEDGYEIDPSVVQFKIGRNPSPHRLEYDIAVVRHTPIDPNTFEEWSLPLPNYDDKSTWQYSSPHNIRLQTAQTAPVEGESCAFSCHQSATGPEGFLLRDADLRDENGGELIDRTANLGVVIPESFPGGGK